MEDKRLQNKLRVLPSVQEILERPIVQEWTALYGKKKVADTIREAIEQYRLDIIRNTGFFAEDRSTLVQKLLVKISQSLEQAKGLRKVINGTGIILHTNLGRAPLPEKAVQTIEHIAKGYANLEYDLEQGVRGARYGYVEKLLTQITGAESALIVNNNAAAVFLCLNTLGMDQEVVVSRGEQVEIGGSFRIPDIIRKSGAQMVEVGTTNKTKRLDYEKAVSEKTAVFLKVHTSNFHMLGFTESVPLHELVNLGRKVGVYVMEDLGSGSFVKFFHEPTVQECIHTGADLITFSGDKLLGGPQAGIIIGKSELIDAIRSNPLTRMVRVDKITLAALEAVLQIYAEEEQAIEKIPVLNMMHRREEELLKRALELEKGIVELKITGLHVQVIAAEDEVGGGALPEIVLKGFAIGLTADFCSVEKLQELLRKSSPPIIGRIHNKQLLLSVRTLLDGEELEIISAISRLVEGE